jgi:hypothetical protein
MGGPISFSVLYDNHEHWAFCFLESLEAQLVEKLLPQCALTCLVLVSGSVRDNILQRSFATVI